MVNDKKNNDNKINLILLKQIGKTTIPGKIKMSVNQVASFLKRIGKTTVPGKIKMSVDQIGSFLKKIS